MDSLASVFATPTPADRNLNSLRPRPRSNGASVALTFSIALHVGLALLAARHFRTAIAPELGHAPIELLATDVDVDLLEPVADVPPAPATPGLPAVARAPVKTPIVPHVAPVAPAIPAHFDETASNSAAETGSEANPARDSQVPHFTITVAKASGRANGDAASSEGSSSKSNLPGSGSGSAPISISSVDVPAKLRAGSIPAYTAAALAAGIEANVPLEIVVSESGAVTSARGLEHVGYGLDESARQSVLGYRFTPAVRNNRAVAVRMRWLMRFQLR
jgi:protein TonB